MEKTQKLAASAKKTFVELQELSLGKFFSGDILDLL